MAHDVFVSYSIKDRAVAEKVVAKLEAESVRCWIAPRDVVPGADWGESIIDAIESSRLMVLVFSQNANVSSQIKREVERAVDKEVYTIPLRIDDVKPTRSLEYFISTSQWIDAFSPPLERHLDKLAQTVKSILARFADTPASTHKAAAPIQQDETPIQARDTGKSSLVWVKPAIVLAALMFAGVTMWYFLGQKNERVPSRPSGAVTVSPAPTMQTTPPVSASIAKPVASVAQPHIAPQVIEQNAQIIIFAYHRLVGKVRYPGTEITPADFEAQMEQLRDAGITVIGMQDLLAWKRGEKNIPSRCAVMTFDDGWKSQYDVAWPIMKKFGYPFTMFIYTEGVRGGNLGGGEAITWEQLAEMRDNGVDIEAHTATHQDLREGHSITLVDPNGTRTKTKLTGGSYEEWLQKELVGSKQLLEQRLGIKVNCLAIPFGNYNERVKEVARNAGYEAIFTLYGQPITFASRLDSIGRYAIEANKPQVFVDAVNLIKQ